MPTVLKLRNHDELYYRSEADKILLNHQDILNSENKTILDQISMKNYSEDSLSLVPSCSCKDLSGAYYVGHKCPKCHTTVTSSVDDGLSFMIWLERPEGVEHFISPIVLAILLPRYRITKPNVQLIKYIITPNLPIEKQHRKNLNQLEKLDFLLKTNGIAKGYNSFVKNFFKIIEILEREFVKAKKQQKEEFIAFLHENRNNIFSNYLPFPNRMIFAIDGNELGQFFDRSLLDPINAMRRVTGIDLYTKPSAVKQTKVAKSLIDLANFYGNYMTSSFFLKPGLIRKHISSTRSHFTARAVIVSIAGPHDRRELHLPWSLSCTLFRPHILNRLEALGYSYKKAVNHLLYHNKIYCPVIDEIFKQILQAAGGGVKAMLNRNPSLHRGSIQRVVITKIKTDTDDNTFGMSYLIAKSFNADYDGDMLNMTLVLTKKAMDQLHNFDPDHNVLSLSGPNEFSNAMGFPKTIVSTLANWYGHTPTIRELAKQKPVD